MKKLKFEEGAVTPFWLKDLEYMQEGFEETVKAVIEGLSLGKKDVLVSGCKITTKNSKVSMTSGWCYFGGEILPVKALSETSYTGSSPKIKLTKKSGCDINGARPVQKETETITFNPYHNDYLEPSLLSNDFGTECQLALCPGAWDLGTRIINKNQLKDTGIVTIRVDNSFTNKGYIQYRQIGGVVQLYGELNIPEPTIGEIITDKIPAPATKTVWKFDSGVLFVSSDGLTTDIVNGTISLDSIIYLTDTIYESASDGHYSTIIDKPENNSGGTVSGGQTSGGTNV